MRLALLNWTNRLVGGSSTYVEAIVQALDRRGIELALWHEVDRPADRDPIPLPPGTTTWSVEALGLEPALAALRNWRPDLLYAQGLLDPAVEGRAQAVAPGVFLAHDYYGTCISGGKTFTCPVVTPCARVFGWPCLLHYYPRRCGGWSPVTMVREFRRQASRLELLRGYAAVVTLSTYMQREYARHGLEAGRVFTVPAGPAIEAGVRPEPTPAGERGSRPWRLLFVGRTVELKGGRWLIDALPRVVRSLGQGLHVTIAGDGPQRARWERRAAAIAAREPRLRVEFPGWMAGGDLDACFSTADLLVLPSVWPEPFGLTGLEAARHRLPVVAFAVGGIPDWLRPGVNGYLADGDPPTSAGLAEAIVKCLRDPATHARLRDGAARLSRSAILDDHVETLLKIFQRVSLSPRC